MIVMKFGGSSVADAAGMRRCAGIVRARTGAGEAPTVVVSALRGVTDDLLALGRAALGGDETILARLRERHGRLIAELGVPQGILTELWNELGVLCKGISLVKELTPRTLDYVASFGERLSARVFASLLVQEGVDAEPVDAFEAGLWTDDRFGAASPLPECAEPLRAFFARRAGRVPVVTGFIGRTRAGDITTLGRNGSDLTATFLGAVLGASEVEIWTDTDGIMTADPKIVPDARPIHTMSFEEAAELAFYGGKALHPQTLVPAMEKGIPVRVRNTFRPEAPGTRIVAHAEGIARGVKSIVFRRGQTVVNITTPRMLGQSGFLARIFEAFARHRISLNMVATSEVSVSVTVEDTRGLDAAVADLRAFAAVEVEERRAILCVVGDGLKYTPGIAGAVFGALRDAGINVLMISQGASKINLAMVVAEEDVPAAVRALHARLFPSAP